MIFPAISAGPIDALVMGRCIPDVVVWKTGKGQAVLECGISLRPCLKKFYKGEKSIWETL